MKIVFMGASKLGYKCCKFILENKLAEVEAIFSIPQKFNISYSDKKVKNVNFVDFSDLADRFNIPIYWVEANMKSFIQEIQNINPELIIVIGWYYLIPEQMLEIALKGVVGIHASLLPQYRGGAPLVWAIINGEAETGISFFYFDKGVDTGDIIDQKKFAILKTDTIKDLLRKTETASLKILEENMPLLAKGKAKKIPQDENQATYFSQRSPKDGEIDLSWDAQKMYNFIRAQAPPYPGAFIKTNDGKKLIIEKARIEDV